MPQVARREASVSGRPSVRQECGERQGSAGGEESLRVRQEYAPSVRHECARTLKTGVRAWRVTWCGVQGGGRAGAVRRVCYKRR